MNGQHLGAGDAGCALLFFLSRGSGAPDATGWAHLRQTWTHHRSQLRGRRPSAEFCQLPPHLAAEQLVSWLLLRRPEGPSGRQLFGDFGCLLPSCLEASSWL